MLNKKITLHLLILEFLPFIFLPHPKDSSARDGHVSMALVVFEFDLQWSTLSCHNNDRFYKQAAVGISVYTSIPRGFNRKNDFTLKTYTEIEILDLAQELCNLLQSSSFKENSCLSHLSWHAWDRQRSNYINKKPGKPKGPEHI